MWKWWEVELVGGGDGKGLTVTCFCVADVVTCLWQQLLSTWPHKPLSSPNHKKASYRNVMIN